MSKWDEFRRLFPDAGQYASGAPGCTCVPGQRFNLQCEAHGAFAGSYVPSMSELAASGERNPKGNVCDCGSSAEHERGPGCTPPREPVATPAAMLGEARELLRRAETILGRLREVRADVPHLLVMADEAASNAASWTEDLIVMEREERP